MFASRLPIKSTRSLARPASTAAVSELLKKNPNDVVITYAKRTALGKAKKGQFKDIPVDCMLHSLLKVGAYFSGVISDADECALQATFERTGLDPAQIDDIAVGKLACLFHRSLCSDTSNALGTCHPPSPLYVSRAAALAAGVPPHVPISTINRLCSSGLMSIRTIAHAIRSGEISLGLAMGVESMSLKYAKHFRSIIKLLTEYMQSSSYPRYYTYCRRRIGCS
jgi:acetyl-CoA acyltransferase 1